MDNENVFLRRMGRAGLLYLLSDFWLDGFLTATAEELARGRGRGPDDRVSPIFDYENGGIGAIQWVNVTHDKAAVLISDGGWRTGGVFHLWISPGVGRIPYEVPFTHPVRIRPGDNSGWGDQLDEAQAQAEVFLGLRRPV